MRRGQAGCSAVDADNIVLNRMACNRIRPRTVHRQRLWA